MYNNVIYITGAPRCGKTTLANMLDDKSISIFSLDAFSKSVRSVFKDFKLYSEPVCIQPNINREIFLELVEVYVSNFLNDYKDKKLVVEGCHFSPEEFRMKFPDSKIICLGRTKSKEDIINAVNRKSWMSALSQEVIDEYAEKIYRYSLVLKENDEEYLYFETDEMEIGKIRKYIKN